MPAFPLTCAWPQRTGYLGLTLLLDERAEVLMLVTNSIKNDLGSKNQFIVGLGLTALGAVASPEMARDLAVDVERLFRSENAYVRKKAALCAVRVLRKVPELAEGFFSVAPLMLRDRHHGALLAGVVFAKELCATSRDAIPILRGHVDELVKILRTLTASAAAGEHTVGGVNDPFLQVACLRLITVLAAGDAETSDAVSDVLAAVATTTDGSKNAGSAVQYECVLSILGIESIASLRVLAVNILGRFMSTKDNNSRYVALNTLSKVVAVDTGAVQRHRATIVECVRDADVSIRRRALDLVYGLVNDGNVTVLTAELIEYLKVADFEFKAGLSSRICALAARYAPSKRWQLDTLVRVFSVAGAHVSEEEVRGAVVLVANAAELHAYAVRQLFRALCEQLCAQPALALLATWCLGEYGDLLVGPGTAAAPLLDEEEPLSLLEHDVAQLLESLLRDPGAGEQLRAFTVTAAAKLAHRASEHAHPRLCALVARYSTSVSLELQQRSVEFSSLLVCAEGVQASVLDRMPPPDEAAWRARHDVVALEAPRPSTAERAAQRSLIGQLDSAGGGVPASGALSTSALADLLGGATETPREVSLGPYGVMGPPMVVFESPDGLCVSFQVSKPPGGGPQDTLVTGLYSNRSANPVTCFSLQAAVPRFLHVTMGPATGSTLLCGASQPVSQGIRVVNDAYGVKPIVMKLKLFWTQAGQAMEEEVTVTDFPPGA